MVGNELTVTALVAALAVLQPVLLNDTATLYAPLDTVGTNVGDVDDDPVVVLIPGPLHEYEGVPTPPAVVDSVRTRLSPEHSVVLDGVTVTVG